MRDPVTKPAVGSDPKSLRILRGLPKGTYTAEIVYKASSKLPGDRTVRRSAAEYALLRVETAAGYTERKVDLAEACEYLDAALATAGHADDQRQRTADAVDVSCPHCRRARHYRGVQSMITGEPGMISGLREMTVDALRLHLYVCPSCGSAATFAEGYLDHPLPGATARA